MYARTRSSLPYARSLALVALAVLLPLVAAACGGGKPSKPAAQADVSGTYVLVQDSDGGKPKQGVTVTLVLDSGKLTVRAVSPSDELTDTGTYSVREDRMTIEFLEQGMSAKDQPYSYDGQTLEIPVKMFSDGAGSSTWKRSDGQAQAQPTAAPKTAFKDNWQLWDLSKDAGAAGTKAFVEAVNDKGKTRQQAIQETAQLLGRMSNVAEVAVSPNGLNISIRYKDGGEDYVFTERLVFDSGSASLDAPAPRLLASLQPVGPTSSTALSALSLGPECAALPADPARGPGAPEPGREGLHPAGGYGVTIYTPQVQPKPVSSADSPPSSARRALLVSPAYDLSHPLYSHGKVEVFQSFKAAVGPSIECIEADLKGAGYAVDSILGHMEAGKAVQTGDQALELLAKQLTSNSYGVIYFMSHGTNITSWWGFGPSHSSIYLGLIDINRPELKKAVNGRKLEDKAKKDVAKALASMAGLSWDGSGEPPIVIGSEFDGSAVIWITPTFFRMLRDQKAVSFDKSLVFLNTCSSAADSSLVEAIKARAFFGWKIPMDGQFITDAAETMLDSLTDKARSARNAWWMWRRHDAWKIDQEGKPRDDNTKPEQLRALGVNGTEYEAINSQSVILIYRLRHGPASASSDIAQGMVTLQNCGNLFWFAGKSTGLASPACHQLEFGSHLPTKEEVDDAIFEVGGPVTKPYGRWTLAD